MFALSFVAMALVLGIEKIEKGPPTIAWVQQHHASIAMIKQALCMASIPGFLVLMYGGEASRWTRKERAVALAAGAVVAVAVVYAIVVSRP